MALINLQSDLKKLTFGEFGVQEPLVTKPIDGSASTTTVNLGSTDKTAFNDVTQKFVLVEYLIKF